MARPLDAAWIHAARQLVLDRARTARFPALLQRKLQRMSGSPLGFLRGSAPLYYELLRKHPELAAGPPGDGWIVGDLHLENFGAFRPDPRRAGDTAAVFDLNDFDDALLGPWRLDVVRLSTSLLLAGREFGQSGVDALGLCDLLLEAWTQAAFDGRRVGAHPLPVRELVEQVRTRPKTMLLDARTHQVRGKRRFIRGPRYAELPKKIVAGVPAALAAYATQLPEKRRPREESLEVLDCALRIAGTGSLGGLRIAVLVAGKGKGGGEWIFDMKEQGEPSGGKLFGVPDLAPAERVVAAYRACVARPPKLMGTTWLRTSSMVVRRLTPQEDKLNLRRLRGEDLPGLASYLGSLLGAAHARGAERKPRRWTKGDLRHLREQAVTLAGIHEAAYLALCERMRE